MISGVGADTAIIESGENSNNDKCPISASPENRIPICTIARGGSPQPTKQFAKKRELQHRQAARLCTARKRLVQCGQLALA